MTQLVKQHIVLDAELRDRLQKAARESDRSISAMARVALREYLLRFEAHPERRLSEQHTQ